MGKRVAIIAAKRTPMGRFNGALSKFTAPQLATVAIKSAIAQTNATASTDISNHIDEALFGNVVSAGLGQAPTRQAVLGAGLSDSLPCTTLNKVCGSGMKCIMMGSDSIKAESNDVVLVGGMESMTNAPHFIPSSRSLRMGPGKLLDSMIYDGLWDPYSSRMMGELGEAVATEYQFTREDQDAFSIASIEAARDALSSGILAWEIASVETKNGPLTSDEGLTVSDPEKIKTLRPAFSKDGTVTAGNASQISDGASALIIASEEAVARTGATVLAWVEGYSQHAGEPSKFSTAPVPAIEKLLKKLHWEVGSVDAWEINEAFSLVPMCAIRDLGIHREKVNLLGGATCLGHPLGSSGSRIVVSLINALRAKGLERGIATLCIGGGEATAIAVTMA